MNSLQELNTTFNNFKKITDRDALADFLGDENKRLEDLDIQVNDSAGLPVERYADDPVLAARLFLGQIRTMATTDVGAMDKIGALLNWAEFVGKLLMDNKSELKNPGGDTSGNEGEN